MPRVYISIGSNVDRAYHISTVLHTLQARYPSLTLSSVYESDAVGFEGDRFYNLVVALDTDESPLGLADYLHRLEQQHGRRRGGDRFEPRTLDLDMLTYGDQHIDEGKLHLPRDEITRYAFVLKPLAEIAPHDKHPTLGLDYASLWADFNDPGQLLWKVPWPPADKKHDNRP